jgi:hypothetical protein
LLPLPVRLQLLTAAAAPVVGTAVDVPVPDRTFQATGATTAGAGAAQVAILASNDGVGWITLGTINLTLGTTPVTDGIASSAAWKSVKAQLVSISGTGAAVTVTGAY